MEPKRFYRSITNRRIAGVAGGLADYFDLDPLLVRLIFIILLFAGGGGFLLYLILWIVTPENPYETNKFQKSSPMENQPSNFGETKPPAENQPQQKPSPETKNKGSLVGGLVLITLGFLFLADEFLPRINFGDLWPVILIVIGIGLLLNSIGRRRQND